MTRLDDQHAALTALDDLENEHLAKHHPGATTPQEGCPYCDGYRRDRARLVAEIAAGGRFPRTKVQ